MILRRFLTLHCTITCLIPMLMEHPRFKQEPQGSNQCHNCTVSPISSIIDFSHRFSIIVRATLPPTSRKAPSRLVRLPCACVFHFSLSVSRVRSFCACRSALTHTRTLRNRCPVSLGLLTIVNVSEYHCFFFFSIILCDDNDFQMANQIIDDQRQAACLRTIK